MKSNITITIDHEIKEKLQKQNNQSALINELLYKHFKLGDLKNLSLPELYRLKAKADRRKELEKELQDLDG